MKIISFFVLFILLSNSSCKTTRGRVEVAPENRKVSAINNRDTGHRELESSIISQRERVRELETQLAGMDAQSEEAEDAEQELENAKEELAKNEENLRTSKEQNVSSQVWQFYQEVSAELGVAASSEPERFCLESMTAENGDLTMEFEYCNDSLLYRPQQFRLRNFAKYDAFINESNGLCLTARQDSSGAGLYGLTQKACDNSREQNFEFINIDLDKASFQLRNEASGLCISKDLEKLAILVECTSGGLRLNSNP